MPRVRYTNRTLNDMDAIGDYIAKESPQAARRLLRSIRGKCREIAKAPKIGKPRDEFGDGIRSFSIGSYLVFYQPADFGITVVRVIHGARDLPEAFHLDE